MGQAKSGARRTWHHTSLLFQHVDGDTIARCHRPLSFHRAALSALVPGQRPGVVPEDRTKMEPGGIEPPSYLIVTYPLLAAFRGGLATSTRAGDFPPPGQLVCSFRSESSIRLRRDRVVYWCWLGENQGLFAGLDGEEVFDLGDAVLDVVLGDVGVVRI